MIVSEKFYVSTIEKILDHSTGNVAEDFYHHFKASQMGEIGITVSTFWMVPKYQTIASSKAASRALDFAFGW
ncbi:beta-glucosidase 17 [Quercus suber]|uniref:Beta-glucosidase 17 n=1 Tax=Quercus suber TaxID=58331 RepID=A0AAW0L5K8_QUESU